MKQAATTVVAEQYDVCVDCGRGLDHTNTHELYLQKKGLCLVCHLAGIIDGKESNESVCAKH